ncbi:hypothetical protein D9V32_05650 [Mycetocola tolaasinivorans]|uniref:Signal peptidase I n=1 Tax=Mycetocola tolaasinivorans TaxID=76635 RepID=A0A3L7A8H1_9MICO|nr:DUF5684 domain-containing protein [Mycetocola tolaasinivorans]RLP76354.1 hypothetical protein D9V32_05650 [Mycetocola tolaasinivorans]
MFSLISALPTDVDFSENLNAATSTVAPGGFFIYVLTVIGLWGVFRKADYPGWLAIIPIVNAVVLLRVAGRSGWLVLLYIIPIVNLVLAIIVALDVARKFGKGGAFGFFLLFLIPFIGPLIIAFGDARYNRAA